MGDFARLYGSRLEDPASKNIQWHGALVARRDREKILGQRGCVLWMTGLSGSGKSTVARALEQRLIEEGRLAYVLDGDNVRHGLNADLGFSPEERTENIRRLGEVAALFADAGLIAVTAFIAPYRADRQRARDAVERIVAGRFLEVYVEADLEECERRDPKGLYKKARQGEIADFTGIDAPYEAPESPDHALPTGRQSVAESVDALVGLLRERGFLEAP